MRPNDDIIKPARRIDYVETALGIKWWEQPRPRRWHRCRVAQAGWTSSGAFVQRCACGGINLNHMGWIERNSRPRP